MKLLNIFIKTIFFMSGFSALIYQIAWQRMLFTAFGVDLESITVIISVFMAGLGVGAYFGGRIADKLLPNTANIIIFFALTEIGIGCFGFASPSILMWSQETFLYSSTFMIAFANFILLLFPTFLMGCTLPLLTTYLQQYNPNIGDNIGWLYFTNTIGAGVACFATGFILFTSYTLDQTIYIAATINLIVATSIFVVLSSIRKVTAHE